MHADIGYVRRDSQVHTPLAILLNMLLALPLSLLLALGGDSIVKGASGLAQRIGASPFVAGLLLIAFGLPLAVRYAHQPSHSANTLRSVFAGVSFVWTNKVLLGAMSLDLFAVLLGGATALLPITLHWPTRI